MMSLLENITQAVFGNPAMYDSESDSETEPNVDVRFDTDKNYPVDVFNTKTTCYVDFSDCCEVIDGPLSENIDYEIDDEILCDKTMFTTKFQQVTGYLFDGYTDWSNMVVSGGSICALMHRRDMKMDDIDIFFYGTKSDQTEAINRFLTFLSTKYSTSQIHFMVRGRVVNMFVSGIPRMFQIVSTDFGNPFDIVRNFDCDYVGMYYDGESVYAPTESIRSIRTQTTNFNLCRSTKYILRVYKAIKKGFSIRHGEVIENIVRDQDIGYGFTINYSEVVSHPDVVEYRKRKYMPTVQDSDITNKLKDGYQGTYMNFQQMVTHNTAGKIANAQNSKYDVKSGYSFTTQPGSCYY